MSKESLISSEIKAMIGKEVVFPDSEPLGTGDIKRFAVAIGDYNRLYFDEEYARERNFDGIIAPPTYVFDVNHDITGELGHDGRPLQRIALPEPLTRVVRLSQEYEFGEPVRPGDMISWRRKITKIYERDMKEMGTSVIVEYEMTYTNQKGQFLGTNRETLAFSVPSRK